MFSASELEVVRGSGVLGVNAKSTDKVRVLSQPQLSHWVSLIWAVAFVLGEGGFVLNLIGSDQMNVRNSNVIYP